MKKALSELKEEIRKEAVDIEDFHEAYTELIVDAEREVKKLFEEIYEKEGKKGKQTELIELSDSHGKSSLVLRVEGLDEKEFKETKKKLKEINNNL